MSWFFDAMQQGAEAGARLFGFTIVFTGTAALIALLTIAMIYAFSTDDDEEEARDDAEAKQHRV